MGIIQPEHVEPFDELMPQANPGCSSSTAMDVVTPPTFLSQGPLGCSTTPSNLAAPTMSTSFGQSSLGCYPIPLASSFGQGYFPTATQVAFENKVYPAMVRPLPEDALDIQMSATLQTA